MVKVQGQTAGLRKNVVCLISLDLFAGKLQWMPLESRQPLLMFSSHGQRSRSRLPVFVQLLSAQYLLALCLKIAKLDFEVMLLKVKVKLLIFILIIL